MLPAGLLQHACGISRCESRLRVTGQPVDWTPGCLMEVHRAACREPMPEAVGQGEHRRHDDRRRRLARQRPRAQLCQRVNIAAAAIAGIDLVPGGGPRVPLQGGVERRREDLRYAPPSAPISRLQDHGQGSEWMSRSSTIPLNALNAFSAVPPTHGRGTKTIGLAVRR
jgi:hypothetical protein